MPIEHDTHEAKTHPSPPRRWRFNHHGLDAYRVALEALVGGEAILKTLARGYGDLGDQTKRGVRELAG